MTFKTCVICIANHKGGVGKTSTALNLACAFACNRRQVLLIDLDPQGSATAATLQERPDSIVSCGSALINGDSLFPCIRHYKTGNFDVIPSSEDLTAFTVALYMDHVEGAETKLKEAIQALRPVYNVIIIDCPPSLNLLTVNALCAADELIIPTTCEFFAVEGLVSLMKLFSQLKEQKLSTIHLMGVVRTLFEDDHPLAQKISAQLQQNFGPLLFNTIIPFTSRISEAPATGRPIILYDRTSIGTKAYLNLADEILNHLRHPNA